VRRGVGVSGVTAGMAGAIALLILAYGNAAAVNSRPPTRQWRASGARDPKAQELAGALKACKKEKSKSKRKACEAKAKRLYGATTSPEPPPACVPIKEGGRLKSGETVEVRVGEAVSVGLIEPEGYTEGQRATQPGRLVEPRFAEGFPWAPFRSSDTRVLRSAPFCAHRIEGQTLPTRTAGFRAMHPGTAEIQAPLTPSWQAVNPAAYDATPEHPIRLEPLQGFHITVIVLPP
jgi:hypothetical protein